MLARDRRQSPVLQLAFVLGLAVAAALGHVYVRLQVIQVGYVVARETRLRHDLEDQNQKLRLELAMRRDPSVVERRARQELHMEPPDPSSIRVLRLGPSGAWAAAAPPSVDGGRAVRRAAERP
jgi:cell division protein FtsL